jgi:bacterioferritin-associated ferredoxin
MVVEKRFVCLCEDVTVDELRALIRRGYTDIEEVKRITGIGTGPCQGKQCLHLLRKLLSEETGVSMDRIPITTLRPPVVPVPFGQLAALEQGREAP